MPRRQCPNCEAIFPDGESLEDHLHYQHPRQSKREGDGDRGGEGGFEGPLGGRRGETGYEDRPGEVRNRGLGNKQQSQQRRGTRATISHWRDLDACVEEIRELREKGVFLTDKIAVYKQIIEENKEDKAKLLEKLENSVGPLRFKPVQGFKDKVSGVINNYRPVKGLLRYIEGKFGMAVYNYFEFTKEVIYLNLLLTLLSSISLPWVNQKYSEISSQSCSGGWNSTLNRVSAEDAVWFNKTETDICCSEQYNNQSAEFHLNTDGASSFFSDMGDLLLGLIQGTDWISFSVIYYGHYKPHLDWLYIFTILACFLVSLVTVVLLSAQSFQSNFKWAKLNSVNTFNLTFCTWNYCLVKQNSVKQKKAILMAEFLSEDVGTTQGKKTNIILKRLLVNVAVLGLMSAFCYGLYYLFTNDMETAASFVESNLESAGADLAPQVRFIFEYLIPIYISFVNLLLTTAFSYLAQFEQHSPKTALLLKIGRSLFIRIVSLLLAMFTLYDNVKCDYAEKRWSDLTGQEVVTLATCSNLDVDAGSCPRPICWETSVGQEFYKLTVVDFLIQLVVIIFIDIPRAKLLKKCCSNQFTEIQFDIPKHVLDIVYSQTICWMGLFFSPFITLITFIKLLLVFLLRLFYISTICNQPNSFYNAARVSSMLQFSLVVSVLSSVGGVALFIAEVRPSNACGPFQLEAGFYDVVIQLIENIQLSVFKTALLFVGQVTVLYSIFLGLVLLSTFFWVQGSVHAKLCTLLKKELNAVIQEKKLREKDEDPKKWLT